MVYFELMYTNDKPLGIRICSQPTQKKLDALKPTSLICAFVFFLLASFTFYLADSDVPELTTPTGSEDNVISFVYLDHSDSQHSGHEDELGTMTISGQTSDGFDLSWELKARNIYDSLIIEYRDTQRTWDMTEVQLHGDATGYIIRGLNASTEYQIKLYEITNSQKSALLEAVAVTGISFSFGLNVDERLYVLTASPSTGNVFHCIQIVTSIKEPT